MSVKEDRLWIADPKALHYILQATSYLYVKPAIRRETASLITDRGLLWAGGMAGTPLLPTRELIQCLGETHRRQRKGMMPAFGLTASRELLPRFIEVLDKVSASPLNTHSVTTCDSKSTQLDGMWKDIVSDAPDGATTLDVIEWLGRAALDVWVSTLYAVSVLDC